MKRQINAFKLLSLYTQCTISEYDTHQHLGRMIDEGSVSVLGFKKYILDILYHMVESIKLKEYSHWAAGNLESPVEYQHFVLI